MKRRNFLRLGTTAVAANIVAGQGCHRPGHRRMTPCIRNPFRSPRSHAGAGSISRKRFRIPPRNGRKPDPSGGSVCDFGETRDKLWQDPGCQELFIGQWRQFARRYKGVASARLSLDLVNEPMNVAGDDYSRLMRRVVTAIRAEDPQRLIIVEGLDVAVQPVFSLTDLGVVQSYHCYAPKEVTHHKAQWAGNYPHLPERPLKKNGKITFDQGDLDKGFKAWRDLAAKGMPIRIGEFGCYKHTPHDVALA